jgi:O-antigen ligase
MSFYGTLLLLIVAWGALTFGAVYAWGYWPLAVACAGAGAAGLRRGNAGLPAAAPWLGLFGLGVALQLVPLPRDLLLAVSEPTDTFLRQYRVGYSLDPPAWHPLSIAPASTWAGLGLFAAFALFLVGVCRAVARIDLERLVRRIMLFAVLLAVLGVVQRALDGDAPAGLVYGFWQPEQPGSPFGPFVNRNHFAGWMVMALPLALGYGIGLFHRLQPRASGWRDRIRWMAEPDTGPLALAGLAVLAAGTSLVLTGSRSGLVSFAVAVLVMALFGVARTRRVSARIGALAGAGLLVVAAVGWAGVGAAAQRFSTADRDIEARFSAWRDTARIIADFPVFGTGLNTYGEAMLVYQTGDRSIFYGEAHNDYLQLLAEGGVLLAVPAALAIVFFARDVRRRFRDDRDEPMRRWIRTGAVAALVGIAVQSTVEFSLQMPGNAALCALVAAIALHERERRPRAARR